MKPYYQDDWVTIYHGDCLEIMPTLGQVDIILTDLPYGTTACKWDEIIPFKPLWENYWSILKSGSAIILFANQPFTTRLIGSQIDKYRHQWIWDKKKSGSFVQAKRMPLKHTEDILVFCDNGQPRYFPIMEPREKPIRVGGRGPKSVGEAIPNKSRNSENFNRQKVYTTSYPKLIRQMVVSNKESGFHPTQKPIELCGYLIKTYSLEGEIVLDSCMGAGSTGIAAIKTKRKFIGIEIEEKYCEIAARRMRQEVLI